MTLTLPNRNWQAMFDALPELDPDRLCGRTLGVGTVKTCFLHKEHPDRCVKLASTAHMKPMLREIAYLRFLERRGVRSPVLPAFHGAFRWENRLGFVQECFLERRLGGTFDRVRFLDEALRDAEHFDETYRSVQELKRELIGKNIIAIDFHGQNIVLAEKDGLTRIAVIDGLGTPEAIPAPQYVPLLGRLKIQRRWRMLLEAYPQLA